MILEQIGEVQLRAHDKPGGFDHAAIHGPRERLYVAHTANDALDVIDCTTNRYVSSIPRLGGVAGALVSEEHDLVFTSNRVENTVGIFSPDQEKALTKVKVGVRPNGLAYDAGRRLLLAANVGDPAQPGSFSVSAVDVSSRAMIADVPVSGRTRWVVFDVESASFYVNIADPPQIAVIEAARPGVVARTLSVPAAGPHGLPDVIFFNQARQHLYVAIGDPGLIEVFETQHMRRLETVRTEAGAHTLAFHPGRNTVYAFLPETQRASVYADRG